MHKIRNIAIMGAGLMGHGIAQIFAQKGFSVILYDLSAKILESALKNVTSNLQTFAEVGFEDASKIHVIVDRISTTTKIEEAVSNADFVIEAVPEDLGLKRKLFTEIDRESPKHAILASNTSMLAISDFGSDVYRKDKLIITHWFNPPHIIPVVEVVRSKYTSDDTENETVALLNSIGKEPIKIGKEMPGFIINRIQTAMFREVLSLLDQGVVSVEDLDKAIKGSFGLRLSVIGVLETMDMAGLDLMLKGTKHLYGFIESSTNPQKMLKEKIDRGELGIKSGKGFYSYPAASGYVDHVTKQRDLKLLKIIKALSF